MDAYIHNFTMRCYWLMLHVYVHVHTVHVTVSIQSGVVVHGVGKWHLQIWSGVEVVMCKVLEWRGKSLGISPFSASRAPVHLYTCTSTCVSIVDVHVMYYIEYIHIREGTYIEHATLYIDKLSTKLPILVFLHIGNSLQTFARLLMSIEDCRQNMVGILHIWPSTHFWSSIHCLFVLTAEHNFSEVAANSRELQKRADSKDKRGKEEVWQSHW